MPPRRSLPFATLLGWLTLLLFGTLGAAAVAATGTPADPAVAALPPSLTDAIDTALNALPRKRDIDADQRKQAEELLRDGRADDQRASEQVGKMQNFLALAQQAKIDLQRAPAAPRDVGLALADWRAKLPQDANQEQLGEILEQEHNLLTAAKDSVANLEDALQKQTLRPDTLRDELAAARADIDNASAPVAAANAPPSLAEAARLRAQAGQRLQRCHLAALEAEQRTYEPRTRALFAQRGERRRDVDEHSQRVHLVENMMLDRANSSVTDLVTNLAADQKNLASDKAASVLIDTAGINLGLGNDLVATVKRIGTLRDLANTYSSERTQSEQSVKNTKARIELGGVSEEVGSLLIAERHKLKPLTVLNRSLADLRSELAQTKLAVMDLRDGQDGLENMDTAIASLLQHAGQLPVITGDLHDNLLHLLTTRNDLYARLIAAKSRQLAILEDAEQQLSGLVKSTATLGNLLDSHLLGTPSHAAIGLGWFGDLARDLRNALHPDTGKQLGVFVDNLHQSGRLLPLLALLALAAAFVMRQRVPAQFERLAAPMRRIRTDGFRYTMQALLLTAVAAAPIALFWMLLGRIFVHTSRIDPLEGSLGLATGSLALPWYTLAFVHWLNRENGLAHLHFRWPRARRLALRRAVPWLSIVVLLPIFMHIWLREISNDETDATLGRALFILGTLGVAAIVWRVLRIGGAWTQRGGGVDNEPNRMRQITRVGLSGCFASLAILAALGYFFTALTFAEHLLVSLGAVLAISVLHGLAVRWLMLGERRLALKRAQDKRLAELDASADGSAAGGEAVPEVEAQELTIADLGAQTRRVLRLAIWMLLGMALLLVWSDIAPALSFLDTLTVWKSTYANEEGKQIAFDVTVRSVLESTLILIMTFIATRNLPGLLEIGVLRRLNIDAPTRYAIVSVVRYLIVLLGALVGIGLLGVRWSNLQWLAAGLTVGLGFGLQEIFGNFISGLIVLFERPCRVGDIISINGVDGTVTRIRTRATTILDWDNKEVIVPNKSFITERLVNWTLTDTTTRVVIKVGVAYRNDPRVAQRVLVDTAMAHELVLKDPAPTAWMTGFGDSSLDFELRVFVAEINQRNLLRTELQILIAEAFRENDIEIAFPTRDVWFRNPLEMRATRAETQSPAKPA